MHVQSYLSDGGVDVLFVCTHSASIGVVFFHMCTTNELPSSAHGMRNCRCLRFTWTV